MDVVEMGLNNQEKNVMMGIYLPEMNVRTPVKSLAAGME
jgi:hypothetical protein